MAKLKKQLPTEPTPPPVMPIGLSAETEKHLREGYRQVRSAYTFLTAHNTRYAQEQLRAGLSNLDRALAPWL